jgi:hypothetical protein
MIGDGGKSTRMMIAPDLVTPCGVTIELKAEGLEILDDLTIFETG